MWALNGSAFIISLALARQGRTDEAALLAEGHDELYKATPRQDLDPTHECQRSTQTDRPTLNSLTTVVESSTVDVENVVTAPSQGVSDQLGSQVRRENVIAKYLLLKHYRGALAAVNDVPMDQWTPAEIEAHI